MKEYFENASGWGVLATADGNGRLNQAVFASPLFMEDGTVAFIMPHKLTHRNLQENPHAAFLFMEEGPGYRGKRIYLSMVREKQDTELLYTLSRQRYAPKKEKLDGPRFLMFFRVDKILPLIGGGDCDS